MDDEKRGGGFRKYERRDERSGSLAGSAAVADEAATSMEVGQQRASFSTDTAWQRLAEHIRRGREMRLFGRRAAHLPRQAGKSIVPYRYVEGHRVGGAYAKFTQRDKVMDLCSRPVSCGGALQRCRPTRHTYRPLPKGSANFRQHETRKIEPGISPQSRTLVGARGAPAWRTSRRGWRRG